MKLSYKIVSLLTTLFISLSALAQHQVSGNILGKGVSLEGAFIEISVDEEVAQNQKSIWNTVSGSNGSFAIFNVSKGKHILKVNFLGYEEYSAYVEVDSDLVLDIRLRERPIVTEAVIVNALRANYRTPMTFSIIAKEQLEKINVGQDLPVLLNMAPSLVHTSDAGAGIGYTGLRIRGSDATRINVTINGIPLNDPESHGVFWVNMPDFTSSVENIQIQRGVGSSTNGAASFGASVNIKTNSLEEDAYAEVSNSIGSFNSRKHTVQVGTGLINDKLAFDARLSKIASDGYVDRARADLSSYFLSGAYYGDKVLIKANVFSGKEETYQSWNGVREDVLKDNRTFNSYTYENEVDNYQQSHYQLISSFDLSSKSTLNAALHYTKGQGYFEQYKSDDDFSDYGLSNPIINGQAIESGDFIRRRWLDNDFYGATYDFTTQVAEAASLTVGGAWNSYKGDHFGEIIWAEFSGSSQIRDRYYDNTGNKKDFNIYAKSLVDLNANLNAYVDFQYRSVKYDYAGVDSDLRFIDGNESYSFFNPKVGLNYSIKPGTRAYISYAIGNREPVRNDFIDAPQGVKPEHETLRNLEVGYQSQTEFLSWGANFYLMDYKNQLVLTGELNDVGSSIRKNVDDSYRMGIELEGAIQLSEQFHWMANATMSKNKIGNFQEIIYDYDNGGTIENEFKDSDISFSPSTIISSQVTFKPVNNFEVALISKSVSKQFLDNTSNDARSIDAYFVNDLRLNWSINTEILKKIDFSLLINNVLNETYESNGYTFSYVFGGLTTENYYYPQAGRNFLLGMKLRF